jgi:hypothetical protein
MNAVKKPITETSIGVSVFLRPRYKLILAIKTPNPTIKKSSCEGLIPNILFNSFFKPNDSQQPRRSLASDGCAC